MLGVILLFVEEEDECNWSLAISDLTKCFALVFSSIRGSVFLLLPAGLADIAGDFLFAPVKSDLLGLRILMLISLFRIIMLLSNFNV